MSFSRTLVACAAVAFGFCPVLPNRSASAATPGVPSLGNTAGGYVAYAETSLPPWFQAQVLADADNTPHDNTLDDNVAELGRVLFYDRRLSHNDGTACASCHSQETGFSDAEQFSQGFEGGLTGRHSPGLSNARYYARGRFFWDERAATLEDQTLMPIQDSVEMGSNLDDLVVELGETEFYPALFERAFGDSTVTSDRMAKAMAQFVRSMVSYQSELDQAIAAAPPGGAPNYAAVSTVDDPALAADGHVLFEANCAGCHGTDAKIAARPENIGLDAIDTDEGVGNGRFKVPSLRNIAVRGRYMHDGRFETLEEVIEFYANGVEDNPNLSTTLQPGLDLIPGTDDDVAMQAGGMDFDDDGDGDETDEIAALVAYLETFTDDAFLTSDLFSNPFVTLDGDYDGDGVVDDDDLAVWKAAYGETEPEFGAFYADGNGDGVVDSADYTIWRENLGAAWDDGLSLSLTNAVPEPAGVLLAAMGAAIALQRRPRRYP